MLAFFERSSAAGPPGIDSTKLDRHLMARLDTIYNKGVLIGMVRFRRMSEVMRGRRVLFERPRSDDDLGLLFVGE